MFVVGCIEVVDLIWPGHGWRYGRLWGGLLAFIYWPVCLALLARRYGDERVARHEKSSQAASAKYLRWVFIYLVPPVALLGIVLGLIDLGPSWSAAHGGGVTGTFAVRTRECGNHCVLHGDFVGDDGTVRRGVLMHDNPKAGALVGATMPARDTGDRTGVFAVSGSTDWYYEVIVLVMSGGYLVGWFLWLGWRLVRRRPRRPSEVDLVKRAINELDGS